MSKTEQKIKEFCKKKNKTFYDIVKFCKIEKSKEDTFRRYVKKIGIIPVDGRGRKKIEF